eukprot:Plantae.Rhodophyta-Purpureofilum_apyrenoidigerum.ctg9570.p1 GENE.Plantae.Rhodophyta-Purpureofilum_apyrenoidigerum.ctg9570~~Plantae.Rhodophyta-Purpureofilum_apyrenoidigerum.ctg9570.p1  ORF type:complete len:765 (+),score=153.85 Plantae.Rhodophyta-Purpureofilum_apyrenoidigerum.ctg9570:69-2297(+)
MATDSSTGGLAYTAVIGFVVLGAFWLLFELVRKRMPQIFLYRKWLVDHKAKYPEFLNENGDYLSYPTPLPSSKLLGWLKATLSVSDDDVVKTVGYDSALFIFSIKNQFLFFFITGVIACVVLIPTYVTAGNLATGVGLLSTGNLSENSNRLWATFVIDLIIVYMALIYIMREVKEYARRREQYRSERIGANYAVAVQDLPAHLNDADQVRRAFEAVFPGEVEGVHTVCNAKELKLKIKEYTRALTQKEKAEWKIMNKGDRPKHHPNRKCGCCGGSEEVDSLEYYTSEQSRLEREITTAQEAVDANAVSQTRSAIVIFKTRRAASAAGQMQVFSMPVSKHRLTRLDTFKQVHWWGIKRTKTQHLISTAVTWGVLFVLLAFWGIISAAVMSLANLSNLASIDALSWLQPIVDASPFVRSLLEGFLPPVLSIILTVLPVIILSALVALEGIPSQGLMTARQRDVVFIFLFFAEFIFIVIAGTALQQLSTMIEDPTSIVNKLALGIPQQSGFFLNYILSACFFSNALHLSQIVRIIVQFILGRMKKTPRERKDLFQKGADFHLAIRYGKASLIATIALVYSTLQPLILLFAAFFFLVTGVVSKHNTCFTKHNNYDNGGSIFWGHIQINFVALYVKELTMIGIFGLNKATAPAVVSIINLVGIVLLHLYVNNKYKQLCWHGSLEHDNLKAAEPNVNPMYVLSYQTPELKNVRAIPELMEIPELRPRTSAEVDAEAGVTHEDRHYVFK